MELEIFVVVLAVFVFTFIAAVKIVPQGWQWTVERFGRYRMTIPAGLNFVVPFIDHVGKKINVQETLLEISNQSAITNDNVSINVNGLVFFQVIEPGKAAYWVQNIKQAIADIARTNIRTTIRELDLDETLSKSGRINERLLQAVDAVTNPWGIKITRVELQDVIPSEDVAAALSKHLMADREKHAAILQAEGVKLAAILQAEGDKQSKILAAEGRLAAAKRDEEARGRLAQAEAAATALYLELGHDRAVPNKRTGNGAGTGAGQARIARPKPAPVRLRDPLQRVTQKNKPDIGKTSKAAE